MEHIHREREGEGGREVERERGGGREGGREREREREGGRERGRGRGKERIHGCRRGVCRRLGHLVRTSSGSG